MAQKRGGPPLPLLLLSVAVVLSCAVASAGERYALVIGIDGYQHLGKLKTCVADAEALAKVLVERAGFDRERVILLTEKAQAGGEQPTIGNIRHRIRQLAAFAEKGDTILVFFSGHGTRRAGEGYLIPIDGSLEEAVPLSWLNTQLGNSPAATKLLILDCCHAGSGMKGVGGIGPSLARSIIMLFSCQPEQVSFPDPTTGRSVFSLHLIDGLRGEADKDHDGAITVGEAYDYVKGRLKEWSLRTGKGQTPVFHGEDRRQLELARLAPGAVPPQEYYRKIREAEKLLRELEEEMERKRP